MGRFLHRTVKLTPQPTDELCWEACARMVFLWKHPGKNAEYEKLVEGYVRRGRGLYRKEMAHLYCKILGMTLHPDPRQVIRISPLIWSTNFKVRGHAMLLIGYDDQKGFIEYDPGSNLDIKTAARITKNKQSAEDGPVQMGGSVSFLSEDSFDRLTEGVVWGYVR